MNYKIESGYIEMQGFEIGNTILISGADEVTYSDSCTGKTKKAKQTKVILEVETFKTWIEEYGLLDDIEYDED